MTAVNEIGSVAFDGHDEWGSVVLASDFSDLGIWVYVPSAGGGPQTLVAEVSEGLVLDATTGYRMTLQASVAEGVSLSGGTPGHRLDLQAVASETLQFSDFASLGGAIAVLVSEGVVLSDGTSAGLRMLAQATESIVVSDSTGPTLRLQVNLQETVSLSDVLAVAMRLYADVAESIGLHDAAYGINVSTLVSGEVQIVFQATPGLRVTFTTRTNRIDWS